MFISKRKPLQKAFKIEINGNRITNIKTIKYLGILIDHSLTWTKHLDYVLNKTSKVTNRLLSIVHKEWGFNQSAIKILYKACVEPIILYGAPFWGWDADKTNIKRKLLTIRRPILLRICHVYRTTSNAALHVLSGIKPLHLSAKMLTWSWALNNFNCTKKGFANLSKYAEIGCLSNFKKDLLKKFVDPSKFSETPYSVHPLKNNRITITNINVDPYPKHFVFTDSSKIEDNVGASVVHSIHGNSNFKHHLGFKLANYCTIPEAELYAIYRALTYIQKSNMIKGNIRMCTDSQTALNRIDRNYTKCQTTKLIYNLTNVNISFAWVRGHSGVQGNEEIDRISKLYANSSENKIYTSIMKTNIKKSCGTDCKTTVADGVDQQ
ncbi:uncharacterized protein LOC111612575 [Centruroides sculpturatus]|uniref:uncharacterized protein LOC111612575 n=1 Tax=Centruroides sculpturatus TaxID=218467 RepID=UPI000C6CCC26|nr:uncharacterized protein LOC111612575 [Centruroides sculpturatus]